MKFKSTLLFIASLFVFWGCQNYTNFTTFFNTFYNAEKLMKESEEEFEFQDEKLRVTPRVLVVEPELYFPNIQAGGVPAFMNDFVVKQNKRQTVQMKLDSIIIKGSKILATKGKSDYIEKTLFLMGKTFFYREEWRPAAVKCGELLDKFPEGDLSPDASLLMAKCYLIEKNFFAGKTLLSQTVDLAWLKRRYDILSEAFRLQAELSLYENNLPEAMRPYRQAIVQTDDGQLKAKWQIDLAALLFRIGKFELAAEAFRDVNKYSPDYLGEFESQLYLASCLNRMKQDQEASKILFDLENDGKFKEWKGFVFAERLNGLRLKKNYDEFGKAEKYSDTAYPSNLLITTIQFERAIDLYKANDFLGALKYLGKAKSAKSPVFNTAIEMYKLLSDYDSKMSTASPMINKINSGEKTNDTMRLYASNYVYEIARIHEKLRNIDSSLYYYNLARNIAPNNNIVKAKYSYAYYTKIKDTNPQLADSIKEYLAENFPRTEFGQAMMKDLGMTQDYLIDTVAELYNSGDKFRKYEDFKSANSQFLKIYDFYPKSGYAPKALYTIGWIHENKTKMLDSAYFYYSLLIEKYPLSIYAKDVKLTFEYFTLVKDGKPIPDSLKTKEIKDPVITIDVKEQVNQMKSIVDSMKISPIQDKSPFGINLSPSQLLKAGQELISKPVNAVKSLDSLKMDELIDKAKDAATPKMFKSDSTKKDTTNLIPPPKK